MIWGLRVTVIMAVRITIRLDFENGHNVGHGKIALLEAVQRSGSIAQAARAMGMSYRRAWLLINELNHTFATAIVKARAGGSVGGTAAITPLGELLIARYREIEVVNRKLARQKMGPLMKGLSRRK